MRYNQSDVKSFFYGCLLGDSNIHNNIFSAHQISKDLIDFKYNFIKRFLPNCKIKITEEESYIDKKGVHHQKAYRLTAGPHPLITKMDKLFYHNGRKVYSYGIISKLTPIGYAMWYADDGTTVLVQKGLGADGSAKSRRVQFCTDNFTLEEHYQIVKELTVTKKYTPKIINRHRNNQYRTQISVKDGQSLFLEIYHFFLYYFPSLLYKMDLGYRGEALMKRQYVSEKYYQMFIKISACSQFKDRIENDIVQTTTSS